MKVLVIADSHGNITNLKHIMKFGKKIKAGAVIHCGDWNNLKAVETVMAYKIPVYGVLGNADIDPKMAEKFERVYLELELGGRKIGVTHSINNLQFTIHNLDVVFCGHGHRQYEKIINGVRVVNPSALENDINFAVYDTKTDRVEFITE